MTLINTNKVNLKSFKKEFHGEKFIIFIFSFLPISLILGNAAININILIIDLFFLFTCYHQKQWSWIKNKYFYFFIFIWIYLMLNSAISINTTRNFFDHIEGHEIYSQIDSIKRSVTFIKFVIFLFAVQYLFVNSKKVFNQIFFYWSIIILVVLIDIIFESFIGYNLLGFKSPSSWRIVSFFKDELVVGNFMLCFGFLVSGFLFKSFKNSSKKKILSNIFFLFVIIGIYLSGERSNFVKAAIIFFIILLFINNAYFVLKKKYILLLIIIGTVLLTLSSESVYRKQTQFLNQIGIGTDREYVGKFKDESFYEKYGHIRHVAHFDTAWNIFKDYPIFGVGNSKFRFICHDDKYWNDKIHFTGERCSNHPHQVHLEILSEQGIVGYLIIIFAIFHVLFNSFSVYKKTRDITHLSSILFVVAFFIPLLPSGSFFSTFNGTIFWINFSFVNAYLNKTK